MMKPNSHTTGCSIAVSIALLFILASTEAGFVCAAELFREDWSSGKIDSARWRIATRPSSVIEIADLGGGDLAVALFDTQASGNGCSIANVSLNSRLIFPRGDDLRIQFIAWWDKDRPKAMPSPSGFTAGWHSIAFELASYFNNEAVINPGGAYTFDENRTRSHVPLPDQVDFKEAWMQATSKARAMKLRIHLGDRTGAALEWNDGRTWRLSIDTRGRRADGNPYLRKPSTRPDDFGSPLATGLNVSHAPWARIAFQPYEGWLLIDDIVVENDLAETGARDVMARGTSMQARAVGQDGVW